MWKWLNKRARRRRKADIWVPPVTPRFTENDQQLAALYVLEYRAKRLQACVTFDLEAIREDLLVIHQAMERVRTRIHQTQESDNEHVHVPA